MRSAFLILSLLCLVSCSGENSAADAGGAQDLWADAVAEISSSDLVDALQDQLPPLDVSEIFELVPDTATEDHDGQSETADAGEVEVWTPPFEPAVCGMSPFEWVDPATLGKVVDYEELLLTNLSQDAVDDMLEQFDLVGMPKARYGVRNFRFRYTTQDRGVPTEATGTIGIPWGDDVPWPLPVMLWLHGSTGFMDDCAPSADSMMGAAPGTLWAPQGYVVVAPDYIGMLGMGDSSPAGTIHPYLVGEATAIASLDSVRGVLNLLSADNDLVGELDPDKLVIMGGSQGGHAALFAERYQPYYAPEFHVAGVVAATSPSSLLGESAFAMTQLMGSSSTFLFALVAMKDWYGHPDDLFGLLTNQEPYFMAESIEGHMSESCGDGFDTSAITDLSDVFLPDIITHAAAGEWEQLPPWGCYLEVNSIPGTPVPRISDTPILTVYSGEDELLSNEVEKANWVKMCDEGYQLQYLECAGLGHSAGAVAAVPYAMEWLEARVNGEPLDPEKLCTVQDPVDCSSFRGLDGEENTR